jgi:enterochelin esterase-like enzyme
MPDSIIKYLQSNQTPIIENDLVTFVWKGRTAPLLVGDFTGWDTNTYVTMKKQAPGIWTYQIPFKPDAYIEYGFLKDGESILDPFNPRRTPNGIGGDNNFFSMPDYKPSSLSRKKSNIPHGTISSHRLPTEGLISGKYRTIHFYHPPTKAPAPLLLVWDGQDYLYRMHLNNMLDNLIYKGTIKPLAVVFIDNAGQDLRTVEYACCDATLAFLKFELIPYAIRELKLIDIDKNPGSYGVLGASMGGLMALYTALRMPQIFGKVLSQSGAFAWGDFDMVVFELIKHGLRLPLNIWLDVGIYDLSGLLEANQRMRELLSVQGYPVIYREYNAGHNYPAWRDDLSNGLEVFFGS